MWVVPGIFRWTSCQHLFGDAVEVDGEYEATTVGGLVSEIEGRIPLPGEVVLLEQSGSAHPGGRIDGSAR